MTSLTNKVDELFSAWDKPDSPGCAVAIIRDGQIAYGRGYGMADLEHAIPLSTKSVFDIASTSKQFVAMSAVLLARQGKLSLDDEIQKYLPQIKQYGDPITIRHLIHHTSGLRDYLTLMSLAGLRFENEYPDDEVISLIAQQQELNFLPGEEHLYSNTGYLLLAEIVKRASGMTMRTFAAENIFVPLGMKNTHFHDDFTEIVPNRAVGYSPKEHGGFRIDMTIFDVVGDGGVYTTAEDLALWDGNFYNNTLGGFGQDLIEEVTTPGKLNSGDMLDYAFGLAVTTYRGLKVVSHGGAWMGYRSELMRFPEQRCSIICLSNLSKINPSGLARQIADIYLAEEFTVPLDDKTPQGEQQFIELQTADMETKSGFYRDIQNGDIWELTVQAGKLMAEVQGLSFQISPIQPNRFKAVGVPYNIIVEFGELELRVEIEGGKPDLLERMKSIPVDSEQLKNYSGDYGCAELGTIYRLLVENDILTLHRKGSPQEHLKPINRTLFNCALASFEFIFDPQDHVIGFNLGAGRVKNIHFIKQQ